MGFKSLDIVVLRHDIDDHGLKSGDTGTVVELYESDGLEVEFMTGTGDTRAVLTLSESDIRHLGPDDMLAVRSVNAD